MNPSGVRFGSAEIYNVLGGPRFEGLILDSLVVGQQRQTNGYSDAAEQVVLFIKCAPHCSTGTLHIRPDLKAAISERLAQELSRRHVPTYMFETEIVPYNANGKKLEIQVKAILGGGRAALSKMKVTQDELQQLTRFVRFYEIEKVMSEAWSEKTKAKI